MPLSSHRSSSERGAYNSRLQAQYFTQQLYDLKLYKPKCYFNLYWLQLLKIHIAQHRCIYLICLFPQINGGYVPIIIKIYMVVSWKGNFYQTMRKNAFLTRPHCNTMYVSDICDIKVSLISPIKHSSKNMKIKLVFKLLSNWKLFIFMVKIRVKVKNGITIV